MIPYAPKYRPTKRGNFLKLAKKGQHVFGMFFLPSNPLYLQWIYDLSYVLVQYGNTPPPQPIEGVERWGEGSDKFEEGWKGERGAGQS